MTGLGYGTHMSRQNNLHIPDELLIRAQRLGEEKGRTTEEVAEEALKRYLGDEELDKLSRYGWLRAKEAGLDQMSEEECEAYVDRVIHESRQSQR